MSAALFRTLLARLYPMPNRDLRRLEAALHDIAWHARADRPPPLQEWDLSRSPRWHTGSEAVAYVAYADLFTRDFGAGPPLRELAARLPYLADLGVTVLHLLPIQKSSGDAGFAVDDYTQVDPRFGTMDDLEDLCRQAHARGISILLDFVLNHTSDLHPWAEAAKRGDPRYREFYVWDETGTGAPWPGVPDIFPDFAPGHWDWVPEQGKYVWSTFYKRQPRKDGPRTGACAQWDLNYANPNVLFAMVDTALQLLNKGVDGLRLDAVPFLWKEPGTACVSHPKVHDLLRVLRILVESVAPGAVLLAEANDQLAGLTEYFGTGPFRGRETHLAYAFPLMPCLWYASAKADTTPLQAVMARMPQLPENASWLVFDEVHDEVSLETIAGLFPGPRGAALNRELFAHFTAEGRGEPFRFDPARQEYGQGVSGTRWSLLDGARAEADGDLHGVEDAIKRVLLHEAFKAAAGGMPLIYAGSEVGLANDPSYRQDPVKAPDTRFLKRTVYPRAAAERAYREGTKEARLFAGVKRILAARKVEPAFRGTRTILLDTPEAALLGFVRPARDGDVYCFFNFGPARWQVSVQTGADSDPESPLKDLLTGLEVLPDQPLELEGLSFRWLKEQPGKKPEPVAV